MDIFAIEQRHTSGVYGKRELALVRGEGARVWDERGNEYIDCIGGIGVANVGHCHPHVVALIRQQAETLITAPELAYSDVRARLLERLAEVTPPGLDRFFLCNSGTEAVEGALKFARLSTGRSRVVAAMRGFHGRTFGSLSATHKKKYRAPFAPLVPDFEHVPFDNVERLEAAVDDTTAAVLLEVVQGEGGVRPGSRAFFQAARGLCDRHGALLIVDEVQSGFGRTGRWWAADHFDLVPDLMALGKAMAGGVPMGAVAIGPRVGDLPVGSHGSTFGGNPLACAAALGVLDALTRHRLPERAARLGELFQAQLRAIDTPLIRDVRGLGLMVGIELRTRAAPYVDTLMDHGILALTAGSTVIRFLPPLVIEEAALERVVDVLTHVLTADGGRPTAANGRRRSAVGGRRSSPGRRPSSPGGQHGSG
jgi:acetylornithine/LysW-gamma-L-lysine aminotransferase